MRNRETYSSPRVGRVGSLRLRVLGLVLARTGVSIHEIMAQVGISSPNAATRHLRALRQEGLLTWTDRLARTLRPTCTFIPADALDQNPLTSMPGPG